MARKSAKQLEQEADDLYKQAFGEPPADTAESGEQQQPEHEPEVVTATESEIQAPKDEPAPAKPDTHAAELEAAAERVRSAQARMHAATEEASQLRKQLQSASARIAEMEREIGEMKARPPVQQDSGGEKDQDLQSALDDYPEVVGPLVKQLNQLRATVDGLKAHVDRTNEQVKVQAETAAQRAERESAMAHWATIEAKHPDARAVGASKAFQDWAAIQPEAIQAIVSNGSAADVVWLLDQFKTFAARSSRTSAARDEAEPSTPTARNTTEKRPRFTREQIARMSAAEFAKNEPAIDAALAAGEIY